MQSFDLVHPDADVTLSVDFVNRLPSGATLESGTVTCAIDPESAVADASASSRVYDDATVSGTTLLKRFKTGVNGATYIITFKPTFSNDDIDPVEIKLPCGKVAA